MKDEELRSLIVGINAALASIVYCLKERGVLDLGELLEVSRAMWVKMENESPLAGAPLSALIDYVKNYGGLTPPSGR